MYAVRNAACLFVLFAACACAVVHVCVEPWLGVDYRPGEISPASRPTRTRDGHKEVFFHKAGDPAAAWHRAP